MSRRPWNRSCWRPRRRFASRCFARDEPCAKRISGRTAFFQNGMIPPTGTSNWLGSTSSKRSSERWKRSCLSDPSHPDLAPSDDFWVTMADQSALATRIFWYHNGIIMRIPINHKTLSPTRIYFRRMLGKPPPPARHVRRAELWFTSPDPAAGSP